jgi:regulator of protease activity HflC (stomatin/prohibitin superfamily)
VTPTDWRVEVVDATDPEINHKQKGVLQNVQGSGLFVQLVDVPAGHRAMLFYDNVAERTLEPGRYLFWLGLRVVRAEVIDMRETAIELAGQELMTQDKVSLRMNFIARFVVTDLVRLVTSQSGWWHALHRDLQLALREEVGTRTLDELLARKDDLGLAVTARVRGAAEAMGIALLGAGLRDVILPGEMRTILNQVIEAEKRAQASLIARREETAATRNLLNTAKLLENNPVLMHLKELEHTEKIAEKIGSVSVVGGLDGLVDSLKRITTRGDNGR